MVTRLFGLPIANASLYDGATAMVEAINLCAAAASNQTVWLSSGVHATWRQVAHTMARGTGHQLRPIGLNGGVTSWPSDVTEGEKPGVLVVGYPNALGAIEDLREARAVADRYGAMLVVCADPLSLALLESPGQLGADVVIGEGQGFGTPLSLGGPYVGLMAVSEPLLRRLPGRLVGETVDTQDRRAYVTTLRAREQDIRREKATSNVCTNQTLIAVAFLIQLAWLGTRGLRDLALVNASATRYLADQLRLLDGVDVIEAPFVREFAYQTRLPATHVLAALAERGILGGVAGDDAIDPIGHTIIVAVTERRTRTEIDAYVAAMSEIVGAQ
jgi:glycine dehydrogenase subunit 1